MSRQIKSFIEAENYERYLQLLEELYDLEFQKGVMFESVYVDEDGNDVTMGEIVERQESLTRNLLEKFYKDKLKEHNLLNNKKIKNGRR